MRQFGFSTGSLAFGDFRRALAMLRGSPITAVELSALREREVEPLLTAIDHGELDLSRFSYVSLHYPSELSVLSEPKALSLFEKICTENQWPLVVHPDVIQDFNQWRALGNLLCIENMDVRKSTGRFVDEIEGFFDRLPDASFCFDFAHARQVDPTLLEARKMLSRFQDRLRQLHVSELNSLSKHERLSLSASLAIQRVCHLIPPFVPVILESPIGEDDIEGELNQAVASLECGEVLVFSNGGRPVDRAAG